MISLATLLGYILHMDEYFDMIIQNFGVLTYFILFLIVFCETGLVVTPFLPGDSLLFIAGTFASRGILNVFLLFSLLFLAAIIGDSVNYAIGKFTGHKMLSKGKFIKKEHIERTQYFYRHHGGKTIIFARFIPIIRTFAPFIAGIGKMEYRKFFLFNVIGGILWVGLFVFGGFYFGKIPFIQENLTLLILVIIFLSVLPVFIEYFRAKRREKRENMVSQIYIHK